MKMPGQLKRYVNTHSDRIILKYILRAMDAYSKEFTAFKQDKQLRFIPQLGTVDLSIELRDRTVEVTVPPLEAAVIELFSSETGKHPYSSICYLFPVLKLKL